MMISKAKTTDTSKAEGPKTVKPSVTGTGGRKGRATALSEKIADILANLRRTRQMSQRAFAEHIGVSFQQYQKYEKGRDRLSLERAILLCRELNLPLGIFMREEKEPSAYGFAETEQAAFGAQTSSGTGDFTILDTDEEALLEIFAKIPKKSRHDFLETVRQLAKMTSMKS